MASSNPPPSQQSVAPRQRIRSPALFLGEIEVIETRGSEGSRFSGTWIKNRLFPVFLWLARHTPGPIAILPVTLLLGLMRLLYPLSGNPLRQSCEALCRIAALKGYEHESKQVYRQYLRNLHGALRNYIDLYRGGIPAVEERVTIAPQDAVRIEQLRQQHGGVVLAVPHNLASAFSGFKINQIWPTLLVARNSSTATRTRIQLAFFERMQVKILMVRAGNPVALSRALLSALDSSHVVAATLDNISTQSNNIEAHIFDQRLGFAPWAAKVAAKRAVPMVPVYFVSAGRSVTARFGEPLFGDDPASLVHRYVAFFQDAIIADPASWAYLADKRWRRVLRRAAQQVA